MAGDNQDQVLGVGAVNRSIIDVAKKAKKRSLKEARGFYALTQSIKKDADFDADILPQLTTNDRETLCKLIAGLLSSQEPLKFNGKLPSFPRHRRDNSIPHSVCIRLESVGLWRGKCVWSDLAKKMWGGAI